MPCSHRLHSSQVRSRLLSSIFHGDSTGFYQPKKGDASKKRMVEIRPYNRYPFTNPNSVGRSLQCFCWLNPHEYSVSEDLFKEKL